MEASLEDTLATLIGECGADEAGDGRLGALTTGGGGSVSAAGGSGAAGGSVAGSGRSSVGAGAGAGAGCSATLGSGGGGASAGGAGAGAGAGFRAGGAAAPSVLRPKLGLTRMRGRLVDIATPDRSASFASSRSETFPISKRRRA